MKEYEELEKILHQSLRKEINKMLHWAKGEGYDREFVAEATGFSLSWINKISAPNVSINTSTDKLKDFVAQLRLMRIVKERKDDELLGSNLDHVKDDDDDD